ncbi:MAG: M1 family metallopeptidase [bacterium]
MNSEGELVVTGSWVKSQPFSLWLLWIALFLPGVVRAASLWEQRVDYRMDVYLNDESRSLDATVTITYMNNSPDTLDAIWFRLPPAALRDDSPEENTLYRGAAHRLRIVPKEEWGNLVVHGATCQTRQVRFEQDGSIGRLIVSPAIQPGDSLEFQLDFTTLFPTGEAQSRIGYSRGQYKGAYWYPMICPYTSLYGWTVNRYFGTAEAYGEFGDYTIRYHVPNRFIVASTGELVNESDVLPPERLAGLAFDNPTPIPIPGGEEGEKEAVWEYHAHLVTEVAFAMTPDFLIDRKDFGHFEAWAFVRRGRQQKWPDATSILGWTILQLEQIYGPYPWPRVMMTDSWSGMEYPMLTMMSSESPRYHYFLMHEVIHNYTPMIIHSNPVDAQVLDEGFTTFVEHSLAVRYSGTAWNKLTDVRRGPFQQEITLRDDWERGLRPYFEAVLAGEDLPMVRGADVAEDYPLLRASTYYKTPVMLNALRYVIGEQDFWAGMKEYYRRGAFHHIDETDVVEAFSTAAGRPLGWFFKPFLYGTGDIDYRVGGFYKHRSGSEWQIEFSVKRPGDIRLPVRLGVVTSLGDTLRGEIAFLDTDPELPGYERWGTWDQLHEPDDSRIFHITLSTEATPVELMLDPDHLLADRNPLNNSTRSHFSDRFDVGILPVAPDVLDRSTIRFRPAIGYAEETGALVGVNASHGWMNTVSRFQMQAFWRTYPPGDGNQVRLGFSNPIPPGNGPIRGSVYAGNVFDETWYEGGVEAKWRLWRPERTSFRAQLRMGYWEGDVWMRSRPSASYLTMMLEKKWEEIQGHSGSTNVWMATGLQTEGWFSLDASHQTNYDLSACAYLPVLRWFRHFHLEVSERYVGQTGGVPSLFLATPTFGMRYQVLGSPIAGAPWSALAGPYVDRPALIPGMDFVPLRDFVSLGTRLDWTPYSLFGPQTDTFISRFCEHLHFGARGSGLTRSLKFTSQEIAYSAGIDAQLVDLYGVTLTAALPFVVKNPGEVHADYDGLRSLTWRRDVKFMISLDPDLFVR